MRTNFEDWNKNLSKQVEEFELAYGEIQDKVMNENADEIHTMLMKNDFTNYLQLKQVYKDALKQENADLNDLKLYEKELEKFAGNKKR